MPRILFVEDEYHRIQRFGDRLRGKGWEVENVPDASNAASRMAYEPYDLVVIDIMIPPGDDRRFYSGMPAGVKLLQLLTEGKIAKKSPCKDRRPGVIVLTAYPNQVPTSTAGSGVVILEKPVIFEEFFAVAERLLCRKKPETAD